MRIILPVYIEMKDSKTVMKLEASGGEVTFELHTNQAFVEIWMRGRRQAVVSRSDMVKLLKLLD